MSTSALAKRRFGSSADLQRVGLALVTDWALSRPGRICVSLKAFGAASFGEERLCWAGPALLDSTDCGFEAETS